MPVLYFKKMSDCLLSQRQIDGDNISLKNVKNKIAHSSFIQYNRFYLSLLAVMFVTVIFPLHVRASDGNDTLKQRKSYPNYKSINASYAFGGQLYNDNFIYNPGYSVQFSAGKKIHEDVLLGVGAGFMSLTNENFIPIYVEIIGNKKHKNNAPFIRFQGGYSIGWNSTTTAYENYDFDGGVFINAGIGRKIKLNNDYSLLFHWSYCHQFANIDYSVFGRQEISQTVYYDMIQISLGLLFK